jgi:intracellular septation protein
MKMSEIISLVVFFVLYKIYNIEYATIGILVVSLISISVDLFIKRRSPNKMLVFSTILMVGMLILTFVTSDTKFIKMKPTILYLICAGIVGFGVIGKYFIIEKLMGHILILDRKQWRNISIHFLLFFCFAAVSNEVIWRSCAEEDWVKFKIFVMPFATMVFMISEIFIYRKNIAHHIAQKNDK